MIFKSNIYFRTDYNNKIGLGHYFRCLSIAEILEADFNINFVFNNNYTFENRFNIEKYNFHYVNSESDFLNIIKPNSIVVIDSYEFNEDIQQKINCLNVKLIVIDDLNQILFDCDAIINHGLFFEEKDYKCASLRTKFYLGLDYLMIRKEFREKSNQQLKPRIKSKFEKVFICLGGSNQLGLLYEIINTLGSQGVTKFSILSGGDFDFKTANLFCENIDINLYSNLDASSIINLLESSDFAVLSASTILLEAFTVGIPIISGFFAENQKYSLLKFEQLGLLLNINNFNSSNFSSNLQNALISLTHNSSIPENQKNLIKLDSDKIKNIFSYSF